MSDLPTLTLYGYFRSSASGRVRTALSWHGVKWDLKSIHLLKGDQRSDEYAKLNPAKTVPTLVIKEADGSEWSLTQSAAIIEWVDEVYGPTSKNSRLIPQSDPKARALIRSIVDLVVGDLFPFLSMATLNRIKALGGTVEEWTADNAKGPLIALEALLAKTSANGKYAYGDSVTLADVALAPQMGTVLRFLPDVLDEYPTLKSVFTNISQIPEFVAADWKHQPDTPEELRAK